MVCTHSENWSIVHFYLLGDETTLRKTSVGGRTAGRNLQKCMLRILAFMPSICLEHPRERQQEERAHCQLKMYKTA